MVWNGLLRAVAADAPLAATASARFRVVGRGSGFVAVSGAGATGDVRLLPSPEETAATFQWQHMLQGDTMLLSLATHRFLFADTQAEGLASADSPGARPDRRGGSCFRWEVVEAAPDGTAG